MNQEPTTTTTTMSDPAALPPGFRFHPTDEELIRHYLRNQAAGVPCPVSIIAEVDIYKFDPWDLPAMARFGEQEWYFFSPRDRKYPNGVRPNRAAASGYWKATGTDKPICSVRAGAKNEHIGVKKALVFYRGKPPKGRKTNWIMHEYRLADARPSNTYRPVKFADTSMRLDDWVLCRIYKKHSHLQTVPPLVDQEQEEHLGRPNGGGSGGAGGGYLSSFNQSGGDQSHGLQKSFSVSDFLEGFTAAPCHLFDNLPETATQAAGSELGGLLMAVAPPSLNQLVADDDGGGGETYKAASKRPRMAESSSSSSYLDVVAAGAELSNQCNLMNQRFLMNQQILLNSHLGLH